MPTGMVFVSCYLCLLKDKVYVPGLLLRNTDNTHGWYLSVLHEEAGNNYIMMIIILQIIIIKHTQ